jgi:signal transduction histidine kinase
MSYRLLLRLVAPAVVVGLVLLAVCVVSVRYIDRLQTSQADLLDRNVISLQAAQELEIQVRRLRLHTLLYLMELTPDRLDRIRDDERLFEQALVTARSAANSPEEQDCVRAIEAAYLKYQQDQARLRADAYRGRPASDFPRIADSHPISVVVEPCQELLRLNRKRMEQTAAESRRTSTQARIALLFLGLGGPIGGVLMGYGVARGLRHSLRRLGVRVQDLSQRLDRESAGVRVEVDGDIHGLDQQMQHLVGQVEAVAQRMQQQRLELLRAEQLAAIGQLAAGVAHEVRNPLTGIKLLTEAALRSVNPQPLNEEDLRVIHGEVERLERTVQHFLSFARLPPPQRSPCDLCEVVAQAVAVVRARAEQQGVTVDERLPAEPMPAVADHDQIRIVLVNLFLNALEAMPRGGRLEVELERRTDGMACLTVCDTGDGIAASVLGKLFTPFTTTKPTGTGLGLSLSKRIVEEHGGRLSAANRPEGGACFRFTLPLRGAECGVQRFHEPEASGTVLAPSVADASGS